VDLSQPDSVHLRCSVIDQSGRHVAGLAPSSSLPTLWSTVLERYTEGSIKLDNFKVNEIRSDSAPAFSSMFVIDYSASMSEDITNVVLALDNATGLLRPALDDYSIIQFDQRIKTSLYRTTDSDAIESLVPFYQLGGMTAFYSASQRGIRDIAASEKDRVVILVTDGVDNSSTLSANDVVREARKANARLYIIGLAHADKPTLEQIAGQTGGRLYFPNRSAELDSIFTTIYLMNNLYYTVSYARPAGSNFREAEVQLSFPDGSTITGTKSYYNNPEYITEDRSIVLARFSNNSLTFDETFDNEIEQIIQRLQQNPQQQIAVRAHTDSRGSNIINERLSLKRARAFADFLVTRGVPRNQIADIKGMGERLLLYPDDEDDPRLQQENRRAEIIFLAVPTNISQR
jgi:outer membrane protein OmpA-like peptidoglycan-associated protein/Mg-chelatase subunit ChlD